jgi:hypothetical protein
MAFWGSPKSVLPVEFGGPALLANESVELREHHERIGRDMADG